MVKVRLIELGFRVRVWVVIGLVPVLELMKTGMACVLSSLLYAPETWTLLKADIAKLETFYMMNQRRILGIFWYEFVTNVEVATLSQLPSINEAISRMRHSLFGHVRRMDQAAPAHKAIHLSVTSRQGSGQFST